ncbi:MAG: response regulator [Rhodocyclaceae bacterium]|nr:response regulator [Rhodocyclaceae bacterium]
MNILIVYDSEAILRIERYAVLSGFPDATVRFAVSGASALEVLAQWVPDMVVADYHLPDMDGFQWLLSVRKQAPAVPVGFATSETNPQVVRRMQAAGAVFFLSMPFNYEDLVAAVKGGLVASAAAGTVG